METVRTPSQAVVIFIFLMITLFTYSGNDTNETDIELYGEAKNLAREAVTVHPAHFQSPKKLSLSDTLYRKHKINTQAQQEKGLRNRFSIFAQPVSIFRPAR